MGERVASKPVAQFEKDKTYRVEVLVPRLSLSQFWFKPPDPNAPLLLYQVRFSEPVEFVGSNSGLIDLDCQRAIEQGGKL
jgi:hypothetical protein